MPEDTPSAVEQFAIDNLLSAFRFIRSHKDTMVDAANAAVNVPFINEGSEELLFARAFEATMNAGEDALVDVIRKML